LVEQRTFNPSAGAQITHENRANDTAGDAACARLAQDRQFCDLAETWPRLSMKQRRQLLVLARSMVE
jgi:hypothetical protein